MVVRASHIHPKEGMPPAVTSAYGWRKAQESFGGRCVHHPGCLDQDVEDRKERAATFLKKVRESGWAGWVRRFLELPHRSPIASSGYLRAGTDPCRSARRRGLLLNAASWIR